MAGESLINRTSLSNYESETVSSATQMNVVTVKEAMPGTGPSRLEKEMGLKTREEGKGEKSCG